MLLKRQNEHMEDIDDVLQSVGPRLRTLRLLKSLTLGEVSEQTGISTSTLSRLEAGQRKPTLELLLPLARVFQVQLDELVDAPPTGDPRIHMKPFAAHGSTFVPLSRAAGGLQAYKQIIAPNWPTAAPELSVHEGHEWMYVLSGRVRILLGELDLVLTKGEVVEFDTRTPHFVGNPGPRAAEVINLFGRQGERLHVRASSRAQRVAD